MLSWHSNSLAVLALAAGALSPCAMPPSARAGDKIEFSAPGASLEVPQAVRDDKESPKSEMQASPPINRMVLEGDVQASSEVVVITTPKRREVRTWDSASLDDQDNNTDADNRYDNLDPRQRPIIGATNRWDMPGGWNPNAGSISSERRSDEAASQDNLRTRLEALNAAGKTDYQKDGRYNRRSSDSDEDSALSRGFYHYALPPEETVAQRLSAWSRDFFHQGSSALDRTQEKSMLSYDKMRKINEQLSQEYSSARSSITPNDLPPISTLAPGADAYASQRDLARSRTQDEPVSAPRTFHPAETTALSLNPDVFARQEPPPSPRGQVQSRPAILPFPKKPGSVLQ